jgi:hypothetical protein
MKPFPFTIALQFGLFALAAQGAGFGQFVVPRGVQVSAGCPVAMQLNQRALSGLHSVGNGQQKMVFETRLHLLFSGAPRTKVRATEIKAARVTVHGYDGSTRFELVAPGPNAPTAKTVDVKFAAAGAGKVASEFDVQGISSASSLDVNSIRFADGSTWKPAKGASCTVMPDLFMLVSGDAAAGR